MSFAHNEGFFLFVSDPYTFYLCILFAFLALLNWLKPSVQYSIEVMLVNVLSHSQSQGKVSNISSLVMMHALDFGRFYWGIKKN